MPRIIVQDPFGMNYQIATRQTETLLRAWFDEILPQTWTPGRPGIDDFEVIWPRIQIWPMWSHHDRDPDWVIDSRALGGIHEFRAKNGDEGLAELLRIRRELEAELRGLR